MTWCADAGADLIEKITVLCGAATVLLRRREREYAMTDAASPLLDSVSITCVAASKLRIGTRVKVQWSDPVRWEAGSIVEALTELDRSVPVVYYKVAYDDSTTSVEDFRHRVVRLEAKSAAWDKISLRCCITLAPLVDPARGEGCLHLQLRCPRDAAHHRLPKERLRRQGVAPSDCARRCISLPARCGSCADDACVVPTWF